MKNRSSYAVLTRFGILGAILATLVFIASTVIADAHLEYDYPENGTDPVVTFSATDADGDEIVWGLGGTDAADFDITGGVLSFKKSPNFEGATDRDESGDLGDQGKGDNVYKVTVTANGAEQAVEVTVTDEDELGKVTFTQPQPQVSRPLEAKGPGDPDGGVKDVTWQWSRGASDSGPWTDIDGATQTSRMPTADDLGMYLRATATYTDAHGAQEVSGVTDNAVEPRTLANAAPSFDDLDEDDDTSVIEVTRSINENAKGAFGDPVLASDADNDVLLYTLDNTPDRDDEDAARFSIDTNSGQLSASKGLNFEVPADELNEAVADGVANEADNNVYVLRVRATDPSGAYETQDVLVTVKDVNESPVFDEEALKGSLTIYIDENVTGAADITMRPNEAVADPAEEIQDYTATDGDNEGAADPDTITYTVEGADRKHFDVGDTDGALEILEGTDLLGTTGANFEGKPSYSITIVASSTGTDRGTKYGRLNVTVRVVDGEDDGKVTLSAREPQVGRSVHATLSDADGGVTGVVWSWARSVLADTDGDGNAEECALTTATTWQTITGARSPVYTPDSAVFDSTPDNGTDDEDAYCLRATATYTDNIDSDQDGDANNNVVVLEEDAHGTHDAPVQIADPANAAPKFDNDQDLNTPGDQADATRMVKENADGEPVGNAVSADDKDQLTYALSGDDASAFKVDNNGQIRTAMKLNFEEKSEYTVVLTATDPSTATDSLNVNITVTDENDPGAVTGDEAFTYAENDTAAVGTFQATDEDGDDIVWSLGGVDAGIFEIDGGELTFKDSPNFEGAKDDDEVPGDLGDQGKGDNVYQVTVTANAGEHAITVTVTDEDELGKVTFNQPQPQVSRSMAAMGPGDPDGGVADITWQWSRGPSKEGPWTDIDGATQAGRTPNAADEGMYLRATASYTDTHGPQSVSGVTDNAVEDRTLANAPPSFAGQDDDENTDGIQVGRSINEGAKGAFGDPVTATDSDNDVLLYSLDDTPDLENADEVARFSIDTNTGQISASSAFDWEAPVDEDSTEENAGIVNGPTNNEYVLTVKATDPSGASMTQTVIVTVKDVNESPVFDEDALE
ncbi:MAG: cadherin domain-containing protein, partial [Chloroflexi bacterium]|nr:cadherin domain-containing protein [Chloroflexota bacterium]